MYASDYSRIAFQGSTQGSEMTMVSTSSAGPKSSTVPFDDGQDSESSNPLVRLSACNLPISDLTQSHDYFFRSL